MSIFNKKKTTLAKFLHGTRQDARDISEQTKIDITKFLDDHKELLVIVADPNTDTIVAGYKNHLEACRPVDKSTQEITGVVADVLRYEKGDDRVKSSVEQFLLLIDGAVHDIAKRLKGKGNKK